MVTEGSSPQTEHKELVRSAFLLLLTGLTATLACFSPSAFPSEAETVGPQPLCWEVASWLVSKYGTGMWGRRQGGAGSRVGGVLAGREAGLMSLVLFQVLDSGTVGTSSVSLPDLQSVLDCVLSRAHSSCLLPAYFHLSPQNLTFGLRCTWSHLLVLLQGGC